MSKEKRKQISGEAVQAPQTMQSRIAMAANQPSELEIRAQNEMAMLKRTAQKNQMQAQMRPKIDSKEVVRASEILRKYKEGKLLLEKKIIANEEFWKLRQWNCIKD